MAKVKQSPQSDEVIEEVVATDEAVVETVVEPKANPSMYFRKVLDNGTIFESY